MRKKLFKKIWTDKIEEDMKARYQSNVTGPFLLETKIIRDENVSLVILVRC